MKPDVSNAPNWGKKQFVMVPLRVVIDNSLSPLAIKTYCGLRLYYNEDNKEPVFPSLKTLAKQIGRSVDRIGAALNELEEKGYIIRESGWKGYSNRYQFTDRYSKQGGRISAVTPTATIQVRDPMHAEPLAADMRHQPESENQNQEPDISDESYQRNREQLDKIRSEVIEKFSLPKNSHL